MNLLILYGSHEAPAIQDIYFNNPFRILEKNNSIHFNLKEFDKLNWNEVYEYHLVIISRVFSPVVKEFILFCKSAGKTALFFFDDDILHFPVEYYLNNEPFYKNNEQLIIEILRAASGLIVSTVPLQVTYSSYNNQIDVVPPSLNSRLLEAAPALGTRSGNRDRFTIGYAGSFGHVVDFRFMEKALYDFYSKYYPFIHIEFMGCVPDAFNTLIDNEKVKLINWEPHYEFYLANLRRANWDIALCPVIDSPYTSHKTNIKYLEYASSGIPGIFSDISIYSNDIADGQSGFLAHNNYQAWMDKLEYAYANRQQLPDLTQAASTYVIKHYSDTHSAQKWQAILERYRKSGLKKIADDFSIKSRKAKRIYQKGGLKSVVGKVKDLYIRPGKEIPAYSAPVSTTNEDYITRGKNTIDRLSEHFDKQIIRKQVLFVVPWLSVGGGDMVNLIIASQLDPERFSFHFITTEISSHEWENKFKVITRNIFHLRKVYPNAAHFWEYNNLILEYIEKAKIDIVVVSNSAVGYDCIPAIKERFRHIRLFDLLHGQGGEKEGGGFPAYSNPYDPYIDRRITINQYLKNYITTKFGVQPEKIEVIHNCIDTKKFVRTKTRLGRTFTVTYAGRLSYEKHPEKVIEIAAQFVSEYPDTTIQFQIVGDGPLYGQLAALICNKKLDRIVKLTGYKDNINKVLRSTDVLVLCSEMEGLPIILLEAMAMSIPCISTSVGGVPELIDDGVNGFLVDYSAHMIQDYVSHIRFLYEKKEERLLMCNMARKKINEQFSIERMAQSYRHLFN